MSSPEPSPEGGQDESRQAPDLTTPDGLIVELESIAQGWREDFETRDETSLRNREQAIGDAITNVTIPEESREAFRSALDSFINLADNQAVVGRLKEFRRSLEKPGA